MGEVSSQHDIDERAQRLLRVLIERYLREGQPVGSRTLSRDSGLELSPATVRNVMSDLEDMGLVRSPHTSAGRIPTSQGLRLFIDSLLTIQPLDSLEAERLRAKLASDVPIRELVTSTSNLLSEFTHLAGLVTLPHHDRLRLRQVEFLPLSERRVLVILVVNNSEVENRIITVDRDYAPAELEQASNYLNSTFAGHDLFEIRRRVLSEMQNTRDHMDELMRDAIEIADKALATAEENDYLLAGQTNLMGLAELADTEKLRQLFEVFNEKSQILHLLDGAISADGIQIFIGEESGYEALDDCSVVTAPYRVDGQLVGVLGVIGPTRMAYDRVIPIVDVTARLLGAALHQSH
ncbi:MAG: heat-inducible transcriptional repressor HrcA [Gammaproteobacteria bacterium]|nr:heat-inducible transcriptional repressor HrcA [Gammaproteobacteria bacterium]